MILISHRGNLDGPNPKSENNPDYIDYAIHQNYQVEVDTWFENDRIYLGHDGPQFDVELDWFVKRNNKIWIHCKNIDSLFFFHKCQVKMNYFWHQNDYVTLTSLGYFWTFPGKQLTLNSIAVLPETTSNQDPATMIDSKLFQCLGICSDYIKRYKDLR